MKVKGMIFNGDMVRALRDGRKTQTRRIAKLNEAGRFKLGGKQWHPDDPNAYLASPWQVGDLIYVRETHQIGYDYDHAEECLITTDSEGNEIAPKVWFATDKDIPDWINESGDSVPMPWRPSIHMPRWASRLTLKVTGVRVERVRDITERDSVADGFSKTALDDAGILWLNARGSFKNTWVSIYGESWSRNDWVRVIDFEVINQNVDEYLKGLGYATISV